MPTFYIRTKIQPRKPLKKTLNLIWVFIHFYNHLSSEKDSRSDYFLIFCSSIWWSSAYKCSWKISYFNSFLSVTIRTLQEMERKTTIHQDWNRSNWWSFQWEQAWKKLQRLFYWTSSWGHYTIFQFQCTAQCIGRLLPDP